VEDKAYRALVATNQATLVQRDANAAEEPRDSLRFELTPVTNLHTVDTASASLFMEASLLRTCQLAGALAAILELSVEYVQERKQFGRQISKFQVIQHQLAILAEHCAAVDCAAQSACRAYDRGDAAFEIAAAKLRANRAVSDATSIAHQVHGAIGFTREHSLHHYTQRLWSWRSEYGNDRYWSGYLGEMITRAGHNNIWADLTARSDTRR
jgi:acyl-CoA dehydrogenase